jgi:hypothetical protein
MIPTHLQPFLDHLDNEKFKTSLLKYFQETWNASPNSPQLYMDILIEAKKLGFHLKAIGLSLPDINTRNAQIDNHMATLIEDIVSQDPNNKVITFTGNMHANLDKGGMAGIMKENGCEIVSVGTQGGAKAVMPSLIDTAVEEAQMSNQQFMIPLESSSSTYNWIWHFPQTEPATEYEERARHLPNSLRATRFAAPSSTH